MTHPLDDETGRWAAQIIAEARQAGPLPRYGTPAFHAEVRTRPDRALAAVLLPAEAWRHYTHPEVIAAEMKDNVEQDRAALIGASHDVSAAHDWIAESRRPSFAELCERRGEPDRAERARERLREAS